MSKNTLHYLVPLLAGVALAGCLGCAGRRISGAPSRIMPPAEELRALWVDEYHAGIRTPEEAAQLIADARRANLNALFVQVRGRADALYTQSPEPPREDPAYDPQFDALAGIIAAGHAAGLEVHAWLNAMPVWRDPVPPRDPRHVFNQHGAGQTGEADWLTRTPQGETRFPVGYFLDPGHPAAAAYLAEVYLNLVRHYPVDGIHFDYIRYPETTEHLPRGAPVGYNGVSLERFRRASGRTDIPAPDDDQWTAWRRQQVTQLVRRISIEAKTINPQLKMSAAVIPWGPPPTSESDFERTAPMQRIFQDWHAWLKEGLLDLVVPMNYARESDPVRRQWFDGWVRWEKKHKHGRQLTVGLGAYLNSPAETLAQVRRARQPEGEYHADGIALFSYAVLAAPQGAPAAKSTGSPEPGLGAEAKSDRVSFLTAGAPPEPPAFPQSVSLPPIPSILRPTRGWLAGTVRAPNGYGIDGVRVQVKRMGWPFRRARRVITDGNGYFGFTDLRPGRYRVRLEASTRRAEPREAEVVAGRVTRTDLKQP